MAQPPKTKQPEAPPARRNRAEAVAPSASALGMAAFERAGFRDPALVLRWDEIAGAEVARLARPLRLSEGASGGVLTLKAEPGAALFLQHETRALCERINGWLGRQAVTQLKFIQGPLAPRQPPSRPPRPPGKAAPGDPAGKFEGSEALKTALSRLADARQRGD